jgi:hypothetical protein
LWLQDHPDRALDELRQAAELSPSFALAHYMLAFIQAQAGDADYALGAADLSQRLSPYDPMLFGILGSRAMALVRLGRYREAADCAVQAAARPNAHVHIRAIAVYSLVLAGSLGEARLQAALLHSERPGYAITDFLATFRLDDVTTAAFRAAAAQLGS